ncbi:carbohydrate binding domain-containing protein [Flavobacterium sp. RHBU_3]|uniref:carbohydrate binding domain-containing protein n=1 Tax=Flavobacterium sp. RHBU_3 TaxID=3391184 RepID=UPI003984B76D
MKNTLLTLSLLAVTCGWSQKNLVRNGGFESNTDSWRGDAAILNNYDKQAGKSSGMINQFTGQQWKGIDQIVAIPKETYALEFSVWIKADNIEGGKDAWNAGVMTVELLSGGEANISYENVAQVTGSTGWTQYKKTVVVPNGAKKFRIMLALAQTNGSVLFDEVSAVPYKTAEFEKMKDDERKAAQAAATQFKNGNFENGMEGWRGTAKTVSPAKEGTTAIALSSDQPVWTGIDQIAAIPEGSKNIVISGWLKPDNIVRGKDSWNNGVFILELTKDGQTKATEDQLIGSVTGSGEWMHFEKTFALPQDAAKFRLMLALSNCTGTLLADDIKVNFTKE